MEDNKPDQAHYIPKDAQIPITIGAGYLQRLHKMLIYLIHDKTKDEVDEFNENLKNNTIPEDSWMYHYHTIQTFVIMAEDTAIKKNITIVKDIDNIMK